MAITHGTATRTALADTTVDRVDTGSGTATGNFLIYAADDTLLATVAMPNPAFAAASGATAAGLGAPLSATAPTIAGGPKVATKFDAVNRAGTVIFSGSVGIGTGDLQVDNTSIATGQTVTITAYSYTAPP